MENSTHDMMDDLLVKYLADEATPPEQEQVEQWISASESNRSYFQHLQLIWRESEHLASRSTVDENKAWQRFERRLRKPQRNKDVPVRTMTWWKTAVAVSVIGIVCWIGIRYWQQQTAVTQLEIASQDTVRRETLPDGSVAVLNKHSELSYPSRFSKKARKVKLKGEGFFNITPDKTHPFIIDVNDVEVRVVGTSFNIRNVRGGTEVIVETGIVQVTKNNIVTELQAGERIFLPVKDSAAKKEVSNDKLYNYYVSKTFVCDNTPLWKLVEKLNEAYDARIRIGREGIRKLPLNVTFDDESLDVILNVVSQTLLIDVVRRDGEIVLQ